MAANTAGVKVSERFGYDRTNATSFVQAALDSDESEIVLDRQEGQWIVEPLICRKPKIIRFEKGVWLIARRGSFSNKSDSVLSFRDVCGVKVLGEGPCSCGIRMWREDYANAKLYAFSEHRMGLNVLSCEDVLIEGVAVCETGGDGLYIGSHGRAASPCRNVTVRNCVFDRNYRQGVSVISVDGLLMEDVVMSNTRGAKPQAGIDFEPNSKDQLLANIVLRRCRTEGNAGCGYSFAANYLDSNSRKVTAVFEECVSIGDEHHAVSYSAAFHRRPGNDAEIPHEDSDIVFRNCRFERSGRQAVSLFMKPLAEGRFAFDDCVVLNCGTGMPDKADFLVSVTGHEGYRPNIIEFNDVTVRQPKARPWLEIFDAPEKPFCGEPTRLSGLVTVVSGDKTETHCLNDVWRKENTPFITCAPLGPVLRVQPSLVGMQVQDAAPGVSVACAPVFVRTMRFKRLAPLYVLYAEKGRVVHLRAHIQPIGKYKTDNGTAQISSYTNRSCCVWSEPLKTGRRELSFEVPETGFYSLGLISPSTVFGILSSDVPIALDVTAGQVEVMGALEFKDEFPVGKLFFCVPEGTVAVTVAYYGSGGDARITSPDGAVVYSYPEKSGLRMARLNSPSGGFWGLELFPPRKSKWASHWLALNGVQGYFFLSSEKTWK